MSKCLRQPIHKAVPRPLEACSLSLPHRMILDNPCWPMWSSETWYIFFFNGGRNTSELKETEHINMQCHHGTWKNTQCTVLQILGIKLKRVPRLLERMVIVFHNIKLQDAGVSGSPGRIHCRRQGHPCFLCQAWCCVRAVRSHLGCASITAPRCGFLVASEIKTLSEERSTLSQRKNGSLRGDGPAFQIAGWEVKSRAYFPFYFRMCCGRGERWFWYEKLGYVVPGIEVFSKLRGVGAVSQWMDGEFQFWQGARSPRYFTVYYQIKHLLKA